MPPVPQSSGFPFGQRTELTRTIHRLIREYPEGVGILKELVQNADDAGATNIEVAFDWRVHADERLPDPRMKALMGPSVLAFNDAEFTADDFQNIQEIGFGGKLESPTKTGRFGVGFNAVYNVTDWPHFISGNRIAFFDPHCSAIPGADRSSPGFGWTLDGDSCWELFPDLLAAFNPVGLADGATYLRGTAFRLPMRTPEQANGNSICDTPFLRANAEQLISEMRLVIGSLPLFLKHLQHIRVTEISPDGLRRNVLSAETLNSDEVRAARTRINEFLSGNTTDVLSHLSQNASSVPRSEYIHQIRVSDGVTSWESRWRVVSGLFLDAAGEMLKATSEMLRIKEKALPWAGAAAMLTPHHPHRDEANADNVPQGGLACFLPLPTATNLPVHVHGFFDLGESRVALTVGDGDGGPHRVRSEWNRILVKQAVAPAYACLLRAVASDIGEESPDFFYRLWPRVAGQIPPFEDFATQVAEHLRGLPVVRATPATVADEPAKGRWVASDKSFFLASADEDVFEPLAAQGVPLVHPPLPDDVMTALKAAKIAPARFTPAKLRDLLNKQFRSGVVPEETGCPCLATRDRIISLLRFCIREPAFVLTKMPLAITDDGLVRQFGHHPSGAMYIADEQEKQILSPLRSQFLHPDIQAETAVLPESRTNLVRVGPSLVVSELAKFTFLQGDTPQTWNPAGDELPNSKWLASVYQYLASATLIPGFKLDAEKMKQMQLVPDQLTRLHAPGFASTPLWVTKDLAPDVCRALESLQVPLVKADEPLGHAIQAFRNAYADAYVWPVCGRDVIDTLDTLPAETFLDPQNDTHIATVLTFLTGELLAKGKGMLDGERDKKLKALRLFPLASGEKTVLDESVYLPSGFEAPHVAGDLPILRTGPDDAWHSLYEALGVTPLDRAQLIRQFLVPKYASLSPDDQRVALAWIRDNLELARTASVEDRDKDLLRRELSELPLVMCDDGVPRPAAAIYDPRSKIAREVLHDEAVFPDRNFYRDGWERWLDFFVKQLRTVATPRPTDLLRHIDILAARAETSSVREVAPSLQVVFTHVVKHWTELAKAKVDANSTFAEALKVRAWLPAQRDPATLSSYTAYTIPEDRLYRAEELFLPERGHLVASQKPLLRFGDTLNQDVRIGLHLALLPTPETVLNQFDAVLDVHQDKVERRWTSEHLRRSYSEIYNYIGQTFSAPGEGETSSTISTKVDGSVVRDRFGDKPCIWANEELWSPKRTFRESVSCFGKYRKQLSADRKPVNFRKALEILGQRARPSVEDFVEFLYELSDLWKDAAVDDADRQVLRKTFSQFSLLLDELADSDQPTVQELSLAQVPLLSEHGTLVPACDLLVPDAPWLTSNLDHGAFPLLHSDVPVPLARRIGVRLLSEVVEEPTEQVRPSADRRSRQWCEAAEAAVRSSEFKRSLSRLIFHQQDLRVAHELDWLGRLSVRASDRIATALLSKHRVTGEVQRIGRGSGDHFYEPSTYTVFVALDEADWMTERLARALNAQLVPNPLPDLSILERLLRCQPARMNAVLDKAKVRDFPDSTNSSGEQKDEAEPSDWDIDASEPSSDAETDADATGDSRKEQHDASVTSRSKGAADETAEEEAAPKDADTASVSPTSSNHGAEKDSNLGSTGNEASTGSRRDANPPEPAAGVSTTPSSSRRTSNSESAETVDDSRQDGDGSTAGRPGPTGETIQLPSDTRPIRTPPQLGSGERRSRKKKRSKSRKPSRDRIVTYLTPRLPAGINEASDEPADTAESRFKIELGLAAVKAVCDFEQKAGRKAHPKAHSNKGFDVESFDPETNRTRIIEVKGVFGEWNDRGVGISRDQFKKCQDHGDDFWLYVVEHANDPALSRVFPIKNPASKATEFRFDGNWRLLAEGTSEEHPAVASHNGQHAVKAPTKGQHIEVPDRGAGEIVAVTPRGNLWRLTVRFQSGEQRILFDPAKHVIR